MHCQHTTAAAELEVSAVQQVLGGAVSQALVV